MKMMDGGVRMCHRQRERLPHYRSSVVVLLVCSIVKESFDLVWKDDMETITE